MGFFSSLMQAAPAAANASAAYSEGQREGVDRNVQLGLQGIAQQRAAQTAALQQALGMRTLRTPVLGDPEYATAMGAVKGAEAQAGVKPAIDTAVGTAAGVAPIKVKEAVDTAAGVAPVEVKKAVDIAAGTAPIDVKKAVDTAAGVAPIDVSKATQIETNTQPIKTAGALAVNAGELPGKLQVARAEAASKASLAPRAQNAQAALPQIDTALQTLAKYNEPGAAGRLFGKNILGGYATSSEGQIANQAADEFAQQYLAAKAVRNPTTAQKDEIKRQIQIQPGEEKNAQVISAKQGRMKQMRDEVAQLAAPGASESPTAGHDDSNPWAPAFPGGKPPE